MSRPGGSHRLPVALAAAVLGAGLGAGATGVAVAASGGHDDPLQERIAALQQAEAERDARSTRRLVTIAQAARADVTAVIEGMPQAAPQQLRGWQRTLDSTAQRLSDRPSAGTEANLAAQSLRAAVTTLRRAVAARELAAGAPDASGRAVDALATDLLSDAVDAWSSAALALDVAAIEADLGHVHVFLPAQGPPH